MIRLLAFDLDGTTIRENRYLSEENRRALLFARDLGAELVPATGRMLSFIPPDITALPGIRYVITSNGAAVYSLPGGEPVYERLIPTEKSAEVQKLLDEYDIYVEYYERGHAITKAGNPSRAHGEWNFPKEKFRFVDGKAYRFVESYDILFEEGLRTEKINIPYLPADLRREIWDRLSALGGLKLTSSMPDNIEINDSGANKGEALKFIASLLGVELSEVLAVGDNINDVDMLKAAGLSAAVSDGDAEAKAAAMFITSPHDRDGLAEIIYRLMGNSKD